MHCRTVNEVTAFRIFVHSLQSRYLGGKGTNKLKGFALGFFWIVLAGQDNSWDYKVYPWQPWVNKNCRETMICPCSDHDITKPSAFVSKYQSNSRQSMWSFLSFAKYPGHQNFLSYKQFLERFYSTHCERINEGGGGAAQASRPLLDMESGPFIGVGQLFHGCDGKKNLEEISKLFFVCF